MPVEKIGSFSCLLTMNEKYILIFTWSRSVFIFDINNNIWTQSYIMCKDSGQFELFISFINNDKKMNNKNKLLINGYIRNIKINIVKEINNIIFNFYPSEYIHIIHTFGKLELFYFIVIL